MIMPVRTLALARGFVEALAPTTSVSWFLWAKPPDNRYLTFYPTKLLPRSPDSIAWSDPKLASALFGAVVQPGSSEPRPLTIGNYGGPRLSIPGWAGARGPSDVWPPPPATPPLRLPRGLTTRLSPRERRALRWLLTTLDVDWLRREGACDTVRSGDVLGWTEGCIDALRRRDRTEIWMRFEKTALPSALRYAEITGPTDRPSVVAWPSLEQRPFVFVWYATGRGDGSYRTLGVIIRGESDGPRAFFSSSCSEEADEMNHGIEACLDGDNWTRDSLFDYFAERTNGYTIEVSKSFTTTGWDLENTARRLVWDLDERNRRLGFDDGYSPADRSCFEALPLE